MTLTVAVALIGAITGSIGAITGIAALVWQAFTWRRSTHNVKVTTTWAYMVHGDEMESLPYVSVNASNRGSGAVSIVMWGLRFPDGGNAIQLEDLPMNGRLPHRLEGGASATFLMPVAGVFGNAKERNTDPRRLRGWVQLATGQRVRARRTLAKILKN